MTPSRRHAELPFMTRWFALVLFLLLAGIARAQTPLPSWNEGPSRQAILAFVEAVTKEGGPDYVAPAERIAVFDNDGTLWSEQPMYFEVLYSLDEVRKMAPHHPEWKQQQPFKAAIEGDQKALAAAGMEGMLKIVAVTHTGMTTQAFTEDVKAWVKTARHPRFKQPYTSMIYAPMLELLDYLRGNGFKTYIVSGGEVEFMRAWAEKTYGIPPEQVIGTTFVTEFQMKDGNPVLMRMPKLDHNDDGPGKPESISKIIGRQPIFAFGNSDGDLQMLQWTAAGAGPRFMGIVHHTDAEREYAYDRQSPIGRLDKALDEGKAKGWTIVDMKRDWRQVFAWE